MQWCVKLLFGYLVASERSCLARANIARSEM
jgi:hypothetical protein